MLDVLAGAAFQAHAVLVALRIAPRKTALGAGDAAHRAPGNTRSARVMLRIAPRETRARRG
ncbi:MAG: hypothetical protein KIT31_41670 [Deltaproteobacteria bacterium]|nr:hypothetical protein [Deltaproteobacteria bacterium]